MTAHRSPPPSRGTPGWLFAIAYLICSVLAIFQIRYAAIQSGLSEDMATVTATRRFIDRDVPLRSSYTNIESIDLGIGTLVAAFMAGPAGWDKGFQLQMFYFLVSFFSVIAVWSVESVRKGHRGALISLYVLGNSFWNKSCEDTDLGFSPVRASLQSSTRPSAVPSSSLFITSPIFSAPGNPSTGRRFSGKSPSLTPEHYCRLWCWAS